jgi:hypothetical protein
MRLTNVRPYGVREKNNPKNQFARGNYPAAEIDAQKP